MTLQEKSIITQGKVTNNTNYEMGLPFLMNLVFSLCAPMSPLQGLFQLRSGLTIAMRIFVLYSALTGGLIVLPLITNVCVLCCVCVCVPVLYKFGRKLVGDRPGCWERKSLNCYHKFLPTQNSGERNGEQRRTKVSFGRTMM